MICDKVIDRVHALADAEKEKAKYEADDSMMFEWRPGQGSIDVSPEDNTVEVIDEAPLVVPDPPQFHDNEDVDMTPKSNLIGELTQRKFPLKMLTQKTNLMASKNSQTVMNCHHYNEKSALRSATAQLS